jgi:hypothetical protein
MLSVERVSYNFTPTSVFAAGNGAEINAKNTRLYEAVTLVNAKDDLGFVVDPDFKTLSKKI